MNQANEFNRAGNGPVKPQLIDFLKKYGVGVALLALIVLNMIFTPNFMSANNMWNIIIQSSTTMIIALGMTIVIATRGMDLSVGSVMALTSVVFVMLLDMGIVVALLGAIIVAVLAGVLNGGIIAYFKIEPLIITLATMITIRGVAQLLTDGRVISFSNTTLTDFAYYRVGGIIPIQLIIVLAAILLVSALVKKMTFGRYVEAIGDNLKAARLSGINVSLTLLSVYILVAVMAGIGGMMETARLAATDANNLGQLIELDAIAATAIGGTILTGGRPYIWGTVAGVYIIQIITTMVNMNNIPHSYSMVVKTLIIIFAVYIQRTNK